MAAFRFQVWIAFPLLCGALACAHKPSPALRSTKLAVVRTEGGGVLPFVRAKVAGADILLLLDTGAARSVLPEGFARAHKLSSGSLNSAGRYVDANGHVSSMPLLPDVPVQFEGEATPGSLDFVMRWSADTEWGILAPQELVQSGWALVIDIGHESLRYEREEDALRRLRQDVSAPVRELDFHRCIAQGFFDKHFRIVPATVNGVATEMLLDTGASSTMLARNNPALPAMLARKGQHKTTGGVFSSGPGLHVDDVSIEVSGTSFVVPVTVSPQSEECGRGLLGSDVLHHCTLVWGESSLWTACRPPAEGASQRRD